MLGFALGNLLIGRAVDRFGVTTALIGAACCGYRVSGGGHQPFDPDFGTCAICDRIGICSLFRAADRRYLALVSAQRGIAVAVAASGNYLSGAIWPMVLAGVLSESGWRAVYVVLAMIVTLLLIPLAQLLRRRVPEQSLTAAAHLSQANRAASGLSPRSLAWLLGFAGIGCCVAMSMPQVHIIALCIDRGFGPVAGVEMLSLMLLGGVVSRLLSGLIADRLGGVLTLLIGSVLQMLALFLYLPAGGLVSLYVVSLVFGLAQGGIVPRLCVDRARIHAGA